VSAIGSVLVDFDGTACLHDVAEHLLIQFGDPSWADHDRAWVRGEISARPMLQAQTAMLRAPLDELMDFALTHCPIDRTFGPFVEWCRGRGIPVTIVSDGFGFYIEPLLRAAGVEGLPVITNAWRTGGDPRLAFENGHPECIGCGTCKMRAVLEAPGPVAYVGEGSSDRYGALYAALVFAKDVLVSWCERDGVPFLPWSDFEDVREVLETLTDPPGPVAPVRCPGWTTV
jgi:2,3-diketo-5-methylthio-1-phosphopentane phosphatase